MTKAAPNPLEIFRERAEARAMLVDLNFLPLQEAVDGLQDAAVNGGLVNEYGQDQFRKF